MLTGLIISTDQKILQSETEVYARMVEYSQLVDRLIVVVMTKSFVPAKQVSTTGRLQVYRLGYWQAGFLSFLTRRDIGQVSFVTAQDPFENGLIAAWWAKKLKVPFELQIHTDLLSPYFQTESIKNRLRVWLAHRLLPSAAGIRVVSNRIKQSLVTAWSIPPAKISVLPIYFDPVTNFSATADSAYPQFTRIILVASRLTREKNIPLALRALTLVTDKKAGLIIAGAGPERASLESLAADLGVTDRVVFVGWSGNLTEWYHRADVFLNTSWYEGYGRTIVEALTQGCPVVSTDVGIAKEVGAVVTNFTPQAVAEALDLVLTGAQSGGINSQFTVPNKADFLQQLKQNWQALITTTKPGNH